MSDAGLSANAARGVKFGFEPASGLNDGDVVAFLDPDSGKPYAVRREEDRTEGRGEAVFLFGVDLDAAEASVATARTLERLRNNEKAHLEVHAHGDFVGFRAAGANGRVLQATRTDIQVQNTHATLEASLATFAEHTHLHPVTVLRKLERSLWPAMDSTRFRLLASADPLGVAADSDAAARRGLADGDARDGRRLPQAAEALVLALPAVLPVHHGAARDARAGAGRRRRVRRTRERRHLGQPGKRGGGPDHWPRAGTLLRLRCLLVCLLSRGRRVGRRRSGGRAARRRTWRSL